MRTLHIGGGGGKGKEHLSRKVKHFSEAGTTRGTIRKEKKKTESIFRRALGIRRGEKG